MNHQIFERKWRLCLHRYIYLSVGFKSSTSSLEVLRFWMSIPLGVGHFKWRIINKILQWHLVVLGINIDINSLYLLYHQPQIRWEYPLNLSILISGGKETNKDSLSSGEWSGKSSNLKSPPFGWRIVVYEIIFVGVIMVKISWNEVSKKVIILFEAIDYINICL